MKIAVISDIHSNIDALKSTYEDILTKSVDRIICTGDLVGYLPFPNQVINFIREKNIESIMGNHDLKVLDYQEENTSEKSQEELQANASIIYTTSTITEDNLDYLSKLPEKLVIEEGNLRLLFVHGSPRKINEYMYENDDHLIEISQLIKEDGVVFGHTHLPYHKMVQGKHFINPGSVGKPKHGNAMSSYVLIDMNDNTITTEFIQVPYDYQKLCEAIEKETLISSKLIENIKNGN